MKRKTRSYQYFSDEKLVVLIAKNNMPAFDELYSRYKNRLLYYFYRMLGGDSEKAQDFLQEIFMKLIENPERFNPGKIFKTWIFCVAHNMCKNEYRRMAVRSIISNQHEIDTYSEIQDANSEQEEIIKNIYKELDKLDDDHKSVFLLRYREGFRIKEISEILDISEGTIKSRLYYTRKKLYEQLKDKVYCQLLEAI